MFTIGRSNMNYYIKVIIDKHLSVRELEFKSKSNDYERSGLNAMNKNLSKFWLKKYLYET